MKKRVLIFSLLSLIFSAYSQNVHLVSPDKKIAVEIKSNGKLSYSVKFGSTIVLLESPMGFEFVNEPPIGKSIKIIDSSRTNINEKWSPVASKHKEIFNICNEIHLQLKETIYPQRRLDVFFRVYNDGVAFRYFLPLQNGMSSRDITRELTGFRFAKNHDAWMASYGYKSSQEAEFWPGKISELNEKSVMGLPFLVKIDEQCYAAITEANIDDWAGFYVGGNSPSKEDGILLNAKLSPLPGQSETGNKVKLTSDHFSPWRIIMIGNEPGRLVESEIVMNLNEPCVLGDVSWIKPGKCAWDHWWSGEVKMDTETLKKYIQFASDMGFPYMLIDWQWYGEFNSSAADITKINPAVDMVEVLRFAKEKNVRTEVEISFIDIIS